ncbi:hypothetical protein ACFPJ1_03915 [Kribbella qitaiheensis]|uniref:hypothetical protein n=1 Tax=Kribbella qitaiheensis TaxID=1544730 RepID=UPI003609FB82
MSDLYLSFGTAVPAQQLGVDRSRDLNGWSAAAQELRRRSTGLVRIFKLLLLKAISSTGEYAR